MSKDGMDHFFGKLVFAAFAAILAVIVAGAYIVCKPKFDDVEKIRESREDVEARIRRKRADLEQIKKDQERLKSDPGFAETVARKHHLVRPRETVFIEE